jgi:hypothetical protein
MSRLSWDNVGKRFYEAGVDRGVLYPPSGSGVSWNGLISVSESPSGGEAKPYYIDGYKYLNLPAKEEFEATLEAFYSPPEFDWCDGTAVILKGLSVLQQPRKEFGLCYRTRIGNDVDGSEHGYKLHLVYNVLAQPTQHAYSTIGDVDNLTPLSWALTTRPLLIPNFAASSHFEIDSTKTDSIVMMILENILYGSDEGAPRLPDILELIDIFTLVDGGEPDSDASYFYDGGSPSSVYTQTLDGGAP